jgi:hypothetical protein
MNPFIRRLLPRRVVEIARTMFGPALADPWMTDRLSREQFFFRAFYALTFNGIEGDYVEFGSHGGVTFYLAYRESRRFGHRGKLWAFDSFAGLPPQQGEADHHPKWVEGAMATSVGKFHCVCDDNGIPRDAYETVPGYYEDSLPRLGSGPPNNIALAYVDCDLYSSTKTILDFLLPRLKHGMIIAFDDYYNYSADQLAGERRACLEIFTEHPRWILEPYQQIGWFGMSFIVEERALQPRTAT